MPRKANYLGLVLIYVSRRRRFGKRKSQRTRGRPFSLSKQKLRDGTGGDKRVRVRVFAQLWPHELFISPPTAAMAVNTATVSK